MTQAMRFVSTEERRALIAHRHRLAPTERTVDVVKIAVDLVALHSSDPTTVFLSCFARMSDPSSDQVEAALYDKRTLLRHHAMRRTLWVAAPEFVAAMHASSTRKIAAAERKKLIGILGATPRVDDPEVELAHLESQLIALVEAEAPITTREIGILRPDLAQKVTVGGGAYAATVGAHTRVLSLAGFEGRLIRGRPTGSWTGAEYAWHPAHRWSNTDLDALDQRTASATVLRAWLSRFGPGTVADLRWWTGWTATNVRQALADIRATEVGLDNDATGWVTPDDSLLESSVEIPDDPWVALLPGLDPTAMGWKERSWYLDDSTRARVFDRNGNAGPTVWRNGEVVGGWTQRPSGDIAIELAHPLDKHEAALLAAEVERAKAAIGDVRFRVRFPSPNQQALLA